MTLNEQVEVLKQIAEHHGKIRTSVRHGVSPLAHVIYEVGIGLDQGLGKPVVDEKTGISPPEPEMVNVKIVCGWAVGITVKGENSGAEYDPFLPFRIAAKGESSGAGLEGIVDPDSEESGNPILEDLIMAGIWGREAWEKHQAGCLDCYR